MILLYSAAAATASPVVTDTTKFLLESAVAQASRAAETAVIARLDLYVTVFGSILTLLFLILGFIGFSQIRDIRNRLAEGIRNEVEKNIRDSPEFREQIKVAVQADVTEDLRRETEKLSTFVELLRLSSLVKVVEESDSFTTEQRDTMYSSLLKIRDMPHASDAPEFREALRIIVESFYAAGLFDDLFKIEEQFKDRIESNMDLLSIMVQAYGRSYFGESYTSDEEKKSVQENVRKYAALLINRNLKEIAYTDLIALELEASQGKRTAMSDRFMAAVGDLTIQEQQEFVQGLLRRCDPANLARNPKSDHLIFASKFAVVTTVYADELKALCDQLGIEWPDDQEGTGADPQPPPPALQ